MRGHRPGHAAGPLRERRACPARPPAAPGAPHAPAGPRPRRPALANDVREKATLNDRPPLSLDWLFPTLDVCRDILSRGIRDVWQKDASGDSQQTATNLDLEVEQALIAAIRDRMPDATIVSEES